MKQIRLASGSPRRYEILSRYGIPLTVRPTDADESLPAGITPGEAVECLARRKCEASLRAAPADGEIVLAADTVVALDGAILGKPRDAADAHAMLTRLSGRSHEVYSGFALSDGGRTVSGYEVTTVRFGALTEAEIDAYIAGGEPLDKAGAYGIQGLGGAFVEGIDGDYYNVMGLPLRRIAVLLRDVFNCPLI